MWKVPISINSPHSIDRTQPTAQASKNRSEHEQQQANKAMPHEGGGGPDTAGAGGLPQVQAVERGAPAYRSEWRKIGGKLVLTNIRTGRPVKLPRLSVRRVRVRY